MSQVVRLQKLISSLNYCSRRKAEILISEGKVLVNGKRIIKVGTKVKSDSTVCIEGKIISNFSQKKYFLLNKPKGYISSTKDELDRKTVLDLIEDHDKKDIKLVPVGRLDKDTMGLIILTNDGDFINRMTHPSFKIRKSYKTKIRGIINTKDIEKLIAGVFIGNKYKVIADDCFTISTSKKYNYSILSITIHTGVKHQIKKMFKEIGYEVLKLQRTNYGFLKRENLNIGQYRKLRPFEIRRLISISGK